MKKNIIIVILCIGVILTGANCLSIFIDATKKYTINFHYTVQDDSVVKIVGVAGSELYEPLSMIDTRIKGYKFMGWYKDSDFTKIVNVPKIMPRQNNDYYGKWQKYYEVTFVYKDDEIRKYDVFEDLSINQMNIDVVAPTDDVLYYNTMSDGLGSVFTFDDKVENSITIYAIY